jgi:1,4-alpha-glucan branching enzyme
MYFEEFHVDGVRFDATTTIPSHALRPMIGQLQAEYAGQGKYLIAEHLTPDPFPYIIQEIGFQASWYKHAWEQTTWQLLGPVQPDKLSALRQVFETNYGGNPTTAIKYLLGSHDEVWASHDRPAAIMQFGGSGNFYARAKVRLAWALNVCALGVPMLFMGTEGLTDIGWRNYEGYNAQPEYGHNTGLVWKPNPGTAAGQFQQMIRNINHLAHAHEALRRGNTSCQLVHYDEQNNVAAYKRWDDNGGVLLVVINLSDNQWEHRDYHVSTATANSTWHELFNSQDAAYGGWPASGNADAALIPPANGTGWLPGINVPKWSLLLFQQQL